MDQIHAPARAADVSGETIAPPHHSAQVVPPSSANGAYSRPFPPTQEVENKSPAVTSGTPGRYAAKRVLNMPPRLDLAAQRFGNYVAVSYAGGSSWHCVCDCGTERTVLTSNLRKGHSTSCGCMKPAKSRAAATRHGLADTPIHRAWMSMRQRCQNPNDGAYANYGGRGISVCERWESFENFAADLGPLPRGYQIERNDVNGNYEPSNCRWATRVEQANNKRTSLRVSFNGKTQTVAQWAEEIGLKSRTLYYRIAISKMPLEEALSPTLMTNSECGQRAAAARWGKRQKTLRLPRDAQMSLIEGDA